MYNSSSTWLGGRASGWVGGSLAMLQRYGTAYLSLYEGGLVGWVGGWVWVSGECSVVDTFFGPLVH